MKGVIGLDLDSVLTYTEDVLHKYIQEHFGFFLDWDKVDRYELEYFPGLSREDGIQLKNEIESGVVLMDVEPHEYATCATALLKAAGFDVYIITARPQHLEEPTRKWLKIHGIHYDKMFMSRSLKKHEFVKEFDMKAFVDDRADVLESIKSECGFLELGMYLINHPWNRKFKENYVIRTQNVLDAVERIIGRTYV
jgi:uncharacterized protein